MTEEQMNAAFGAVQTSIQQLAADQLLYGVLEGGSVDQTSGPSLSVIVTGTTAYDALGERISSAGDTVDCSQDSLHVSTAVAGAGNEKYISIFFEFERALSDPVIDGNGASVYYVQAESYAYNVVQGAEAPVGTAALPALISPTVLLADLHRIFGQTSFLNSDISFNRQQTPHDPNAIVRVDMVTSTANPFNNATSTPAVVTGASGALTVRTGDKIFLSWTACVGATGGGQPLVQLAVIDGVTTFNVGTPCLGAVNLSNGVQSGSAVYTVVTPGTFTYELRATNDNGPTGNVAVVLGATLSVIQVRP